MTRGGRVGLIGGTFDPIHCGHVEAARVAEQILGLDRVTLIPSRLPPHRTDTPQAGGYHRFAMAALAAAPYESWRLSDIELERPGRSFTFDTLSDLIREGHRPSHMFFLLGSDAFAEIATWSRYPAVLDLAHFVVVARPGTSLVSLRHRVPDLASRMVDPAGLGGTMTTTHVVLLEAKTPEVSSTDIRARVRAGRSIAGLVPDTVAAYINAQRLYRPQSDDPHSPAGR